ncbi:MAG: arginine--tRNA ligase [Candidatus Pacearchaeota archaeon]
MFEEKIKDIIAKALKDFNLKKEEIVLEKPKEAYGDFAFPCFSLARVLKRSPLEIAEELAKKIKPTKEIEKVVALQGYVNFFINKEIMAENILSEILGKKNKYGNGNCKEKIMTEFCHANTHKAFHIGHTRNICLGESISRILEKNGCKVIRVNYQGDIGMHVAKTLWGLMNLKKLNLKVPKKNKGSWLGIVYAKASRAAENEKIAKEIDEINRKLYARDKKLVKLWKKTRQWSLDYFEKVVYPDFNVKFDRFYFESEVERKGVEIVKELLEKGIAKKSEGAIVMDLEKFGLGVFLLLKSDGTPLYSTKDLALAILQNKEYNPDQILHIVGSEQNLYFKQLIKTLEIILPDIAKKEKHVTYELVILPSGKMASREGEVVLYEDTLKKLIELAKKEIRKRAKLRSEELERRAKKIALSAIKYTMLSQSMKKTIVFNENEIIRFEGDTGPYLLYTYARASSIIRKSKKKKITFKIKSLKEQEVKLIKMLSNFPETVERAKKELDPSLIANYSYWLAQIFNEFYHSCPVLKSSEKDQRLAMVQATRIVLKESLRLLGIETIERM